MSKLEDLVPPLELCKLIPEGEFEDSAFMCEETVGMASRKTLDIRIIPRQRITSNPYIDRHLGKEYYVYPAPTLEENLDALFQDGDGFDVCVFWDGGWHVRENGNEEYMPYSKSTAALKLWLKLKGIEDGK